MRLRDIKELLSNNLPILKMIEAVGNQGPGNAFFRISNYKEAFEAIIKLEHLNFIATDCENIKALDVFNARTITILIDSNDYSQLRVNLDRIMLKVEALISAIDQVIPSQNVFSVSIKLPPVTTLSKLSEVTKDISNALEQTLLHPKIEGRVELQNFDSGSNWFEIILGSAPAMIFLGKLVWSALEINKKMIENSTMKQRLESLKIKNDALRTLEETLSVLATTMEQELSDKCQDNALKIIEESDLPITDNEYISKVAHSIKIIAQLIYDGAEFLQPTITQSDSSQLFPDFQNLNLPESPVMQLSGDNPTQV
ncbi:hypothetical protein [Desulfosporosinus fructosivorans]